MIEKFTHNKIANILVGILLLAGIAYYLVSFGRQIKGVTSICSMYPVGSSITGIENAAKNFPVMLSGPVEGNNSNHYFVCSEFSMCDISCDIEVQNGIVIEAVLHNVST